MNHLRTLTKFIVGKERGRSSIVELQHLNLIGGDLQIRGLCNVKNPNQAGLANLAAKTGLQILQLFSVENEGSWTPSDPYIDDDDVLENLRPPNNSKRLTIGGFAGTRFPSWMSSLWLPNLVEVRLYYLKRCERLPPLGHLPSLKYLDIIHGYDVRRIGGEFYGDGGTFPSLQRLILWDMPELEEWSIATESGMESSIYPRLELLQILNCPNLSRGQPCILSSATELTIYRSNEELLSGRCLGVGGGGGMPSKIKKLAIAACTASSVSGYWEGLQHLINLEELEILGCSEMTCLPEGILPHHFPKLKSLTLNWNHQLVSLAGGGGDGQLQPPPFFTALQRLQIDKCEALTSLPEWLVNLTTLQELKIRNCPLLETRYKRESGQDWNKIAHIPSVTITSHCSIRSLEETTIYDVSAFSICCL